jgi:predicted transcriptional regulator
MATITIQLPDSEKELLEKFCQKTERTQSDVVRACIRSLIQQMPAVYGISGWVSNPTRFFLTDGSVLSEEEAIAQMPEAYAWWLQAYGSQAAVPATTIKV